MAVTKAEAAHRIGLLVQRFEEQKESYRSSEYNETLTRRDFIDPFFKALGWDMDNENGYAESYREVIHEDRIRVGQAIKAPDYSFRLAGGRRLFFVEAKKPSVYIQKEVMPAYQVRRYGWSAGLSLSIITDFEEFAVYDCTKKPNPSDKASTARIRYLTYDRYLADFDFIWDTFSREKVLKGNFDRFVKSDKKGTARVDSEFLHSLNSWREKLALSISANNRLYDEASLNLVVQQIIDRIIFLRIAEDRGVEPYGSLKACIKSGILYQNLLSQFQKADEKYNSGLFDLVRDRISTRISVDDKVIRSIIQELYYPESPYAFSVLPVEILGTAYEQFLGKRIVIGAGNRARIEDKPEVRKAGGIYYTPQSIVSQIVQKVLGPLVEGKTPAAISRLKILDPACGSGSFLLGAYDYLLQYHRHYYLASGKQSRGGRHDVLTPSGELSTAEKKRILINNIFGVDLDTNAVEVTKLSLLIKCMEGETEASIATQLRLFHDRVLPSLDRNIKNGNSLVDTDMYDEESEEGFAAIRPFSWTRVFPDVLSNGGFDAVVGNPPYVQLKHLGPQQQQYFARHYRAGTDLFSIFIERSLGLLKNGCSLGFIVPSLFLKGVQYKWLREVINASCKTAEISEQGDGVFEKVNMPTCIVLLQKGQPKRGTNHFENKYQDLFAKTGMLPLGHMAAITRGLEIGRDRLSDRGEVACITGGDIDAYLVRRLQYIGKKVQKEFSKNEEVFLPPRVMVRETGSRFYAAIDRQGLLTTRSIYNIRLQSGPYSPETLAGILNSRLFCFYFSSFIAPDTRVFPKIRIAQLKEIPLPAAPPDKILNELNAAVQRITALRAQATDNQDEPGMQLQHYLDRVDHLVYALYRLDAQEITLVEKQQAGR